MLRVFHNFSVRFFDPNASKPLVFRRDLAGE